MCLATHQIAGKRARGVYLIQLHAYASRSPQPPCPGSLLQFFPSTRYLDYAVRVEEYTLTKAANLVLNVDGCIGAVFLDLLASSGAFTEKEAKEVRARARACGCECGPCACTAGRACAMLMFCPGIGVASTASCSHRSKVGAHTNEPGSCSAAQPTLAPEAHQQRACVCVQVVDIGYLNALFVVARSIGLVGHALDQKRLQQPLYRHPWEDVLYTS